MILNIFAYYLNFLILIRSVSLFDFVVPQYSTNSNEPLKAEKIPFAAKNKCWKCSFKSPMALAVLQKNRPYIYYMNFLNDLKLPELTNRSKLIINKYRVPNKFLGSP